MEYYSARKMEYYSAIKWNTLDSVLIRWMKLQTEVGQKEKDKYRILMDVMESRRMVLISSYL